MKPHGHDGQRRPAPEQLAAYADGELTGPARAAVEAWLADHPEGRAEVEAVRCLDRLWQAHTPPEPDAAAWDAALARIEGRLPNEAAQPRRRPWLWAVLLPPAAAAVLLAIVVGSRWFRPADEPGPAPVAAAAEPLPVLSDDDVDIISMDYRDRHALVVGEPPLREVMALLEPDEVRVDQMRPDPDGMQPHVLRDGSAPPMVVPMPRSSEPVWEKP